MTRAAVLPTPGDPFLNKLWFKFFEEKWQDEVDHLYVLVNSRIEKKVVNFLRKMYQSNPKVTFMYEDHMIEHGWALKKLILECKEDLVMLIEDDGLIFKSGAVKEQFDKIEKGEIDIVAGHRQSATPGISQATNDRFSVGSNECFMWPNFLFVKTEALKKTDMVFGSKGFKAGEEVPYLNWTATQEEAMDTFGWAAIQLRSQGQRIEYIEQYHAMNDDLWWYNRRERMWDGNCKWTHWGSLSSMMTNFLMDKRGRPLEHRMHIKGRNMAISNSDPMEDEGVKADFESRIANIGLAFDITQGECDSISNFREEYKNAIERVISVFDLRRDQLDFKKRIYKELFEI